MISLSDLDFIGLISLLLKLIMINPNWLEQIDSSNDVDWRDRCNDQSASDILEDDMSKYL